mgnify:FL=1
MDNKKAKKSVRERKGMGARISNLDIARFKRAMAKRGQKPVFKTGTKEKVKGLTQKATMTKLTPRQIQKIKDEMPSNVFKRIPAPKPSRPKLQKRGPKGMRSMMKGAGGAGVMAAAKRAMKKKVKK